MGEIKKALKKRNEFLKFAKQSKYDGDINKLIYAFGGCLECAKEKFADGGIMTINEIVKSDPSYQEDMKTVGQISGIGGGGGSGMSWLDSIIGGLFAVGSNIGAGHALVDATNDIFEGSSKSNKNAEMFKYGGMLNEMNTMKYKGANHENGGINISEKGVPTTSSQKEVEGDELMVKLNEKLKLIFSKRLKV